MMTDQMPFSAKISCGLPIALVALSLAFGASAVRAQSDTVAPSWQEITIDPIMNAVHAVEERLASIEATVALFAGSFTTAQLTTRELCVSDETGAQTCITKAQLDALLGKVARAAVTDVPPAAVAPPAAAVIDAPAAITERKSSAAEPAIETATALTGTAIVTTPTVVAAPAIEPPAPAGKVTSSAALDPAADETTIVIVPEPAAIPAEGILDDNAPRDEEPAHTGTVGAAPSRDAIISYPEVEITIPDAIYSAE